MTDGERTALSVEIIELAKAAMELRFQKRTTEADALSIKVAEKVEELQKA